MPCEHQYLSGLEPSSPHMSSASLESSAFLESLVQHTYPSLVQWWLLLVSELGMRDSSSCA
jgi:hypothetical protein